jgi:Tfp pilus assembly protein PilF
MPPRRQKKSLRTPAVEPRAEPSVSVPTLIALALVLLTALVYAQVLGHDFVDLDDGLYVVNNPHVTTGLTVENIRWAFTTGHAANWHPLTWLSHQLDVSLFGLNPGLHHAVSVGWHLANTLLLFGLLRVMTGTLWRSAFVAALFAMHPTHVESVAWVAERKDVLSTFFWIAATWAYVNWVRHPGAGRYALVAGAMALGLLAKPMLVTLPFALLLLDVWPLGRAHVPLSRRVIEKVPLIALSVASSVITVIMQAGGGAISGADVVPVAGRVSNAIVAIGEYLRMLVWPVDLAVFYPYVMRIPWTDVLQAAAVITVISIVAWRSRARHPAVLTGWLWFIGTLVPVLGLIQVGTQSHADRYTYVPYIGLFIAAAWGGRAIATRVHMTPSFLRVVATALVLACAWVARTQTAMWVNSEAMWLRAVTATTGNARAHNALGALYGNEGRAEEAAANFREALRLRPDLTEARHVFPNLARSLMAQGLVTEALPYLERAIALNPDRADLRHDLALAFFGLERTEDALASWREAIRLNPDFDDAYFTMGMVLAAQGRRDDARRAFAEVLRIKPDRDDARKALESLNRK